MDLSSAERSMVISSNNFFYVMLFRPVKLWRHMSFVREIPLTKASDVEPWQTTEPAIETPVIPDKSPQRIGAIIKCINRKMLVTFASCLTIVRCLYYADNFLRNPQGRAMGSFIFARTKSDLRSASVSVELYSVQYHIILHRVMTLLDCFTVNIIPRSTLLCWYFSQYSQ